MMSKEEIRLVNKKIREMMDYDDVVQYSECITIKLLDLVAYKSAKVVAIYSSINNEVLTDKIEDYTVRYNKRVCYPKVNKETNSMEFYYATSKDLVRGEYGILSPKDGCEKVDINDIDLVIVPAVALSLQGGRVGYGGGYYDKFLANISNQTTKVGLCYNENLLYSLPTNKDDQKMDYLITEKGLFLAKEPGDWMVLENKFLSAHGTMEEEKEYGVPIYVKAELLTDFRYIYDDILDTAVDYPMIMEILSTHATTYSANLLETVAENMARTILINYPQIYEVIIEIQKENPDIGLFAVKLRKCQNEYFI